VIILVISSYDKKRNTKGMVTETLENSNRTIAGFLDYLLREYERLYDGKDLYLGVYVASACRCIKREKVRCHFVWEGGTQGGRERDRGKPRSGPSSIQQCYGGILL